LAEAIPDQSALRAEKVRSVVERVKQKSAQRRVSQPNSEVYDLSDKKAIKQAKKVFKAQSKAQKKLIKLAKKQLKLAKKQQKLESLVSQSTVVSLPKSASQTLSNDHLH
jgi:replicative DNA helicase